MAIDTLDSQWPPVVTIGDYRLNGHDKASLDQLLRRKSTRTISLL